MSTSKQPLKRGPKKGVAVRLTTEMPQHHLDICDRFRLARKEAGVTQYEWSKELSLTESYIKAIEARTFTPNIFAIKQLRKKGYTYDWILDGTGKKKIIE